MTWRQACQSKPLCTRNPNETNERGNLSPGARRDGPWSLDCVEGPAAPSWPPPTGPRQLELSRADGTRLRRHGVEAPWPLAALVRALVAGRAGCHGPPKAGSCSPRTPWMSAQVLLDWPPWVGRPLETTRWRGPATCSATVRARRSSWCATMGRATGSACKDCRKVAATGGPRPPTHGGPCLRVS